ncbi:MAG: hypothetical protein JW939_00435, partial [Candidatus Thermoplasmatota archaeon]|nr:hypothetical protein [Candidatus Thermoplasmatota archaeon]
MRYRTPVALVVCSVLLAGIFMMSPGPIAGSEVDPPCIGSRLEIDLGRVDPELREEWIDGRLWSTIGFENALHPPTGGEPSVPVISHPLEVPYEVLNIELMRSDPLQIKLPFKLPPSPTILPMTEENMQEASPLVPDWERYCSGETFPAEPLLWKHTGWGWKEGQRYGHYSVSASPFDYDPVNDELTFYTSVKLVLTVGEPEPALS